MDGFGRTIKTEAGDATSTKSIVDTVYAPCGCTPMGKMKQTSLPYAPGGTQYCTAASDAVTTAWGQGYGYDGFSNLTRNRVTLPAGGTGQYDAENRLMAVPGIQYGYDAANKRMWKWAGTRDKTTTPQELSCPSTALRAGVSESM
jgi:hypothetical protein